MCRNITTNIEILRVKDLMQLYGFNLDEAYDLLNTKGCPVLPRRTKGPYRVIKDEFENWLRSRRV